MSAPFPQVKTETEYVPFVGGLDLVSPALNIKPGHLISCQNYIPDLNGGYRLAGMYERYDGRFAPSAATYQAVSCTITSTPAIGATVTIGAATGLFAGLITGGCVLTGVSGTIPGNTSMTVLGSPVGTTAASINLSAATPQEDADRRNLAATVYRNLIAAPAGSGPIRGVVQYQGLTLCFRDNGGGTAGQMYRATSGGWSLVDLGEEVLFTNANTSVGAADVLTQGAVTATIRKVIVETGTLLSGTNTGRLIISGRTGGNLAAGAATSTGGGALTLSGAQTANTLPPGGTYQFDVFNFGGQLTTSNLYGCNGVGRAFEFDGTTFAFIRTGAASDTPKFLIGHRNYLYLAIGSSMMNSSVGNPHRFVVAEGASEIAVGDTISGFASLPGEALGILCRNSSYQLNGASSSTWSLQVIASDVGAVPYTVQTMTDTYMLDDRGITSVRQSDLYGNFVAATLTRKVQPLINSIRGKIVGTWVNRQRSLYNIILNDGTGVVLGIQGETLFGVTTLQYGFTPSCVFSGEDAGGIERIFAGATNGMVYELDVGQSADGASFEAFIRLAYNSSKSPRIRKRYRKMVLQMASDNYSQISFSAEMSYGNPSVNTLVTDSGEAVAGGSFWNTVDWDEFYWSSQDVYEPEFSLSGTGENIAFLFYKNNATDLGHVIQGGVVHFTPRRLQR